MPSSHADGRSTFDGGGWSKGQGAKGSANQHPRTDGPEPQDRSVLRCPHRFCCAPTGSSNKGRFLLRCMSPLMALDDLRCNAQISVGIGAISDIKGGLGGLKSGAYDPYRTRTPICLQPRGSLSPLRNPACLHVGPRYSFRRSIHEYFRRKSLPAIHPSHADTSRSPTTAS